jgi:hypothetical protein
MLLKLDLCAAIMHLLYGDFLALYNFNNQSIKQLYYVRELKFNTAYKSCSVNPVKYMYTDTPLGQAKSVLILGVSSFQGVKRSVSEKIIVWTSKGVLILQDVLI